MNRDDILRMAREAGIDAEQDTLCRYEGWVEPMEKFANLVAAAEREASVDVINELFGAERDRNVMFSEGYDYALSQIKQFLDGRS